MKRLGYSWLFAVVGAATASVAWVPGGDRAVHLGLVAGLMASLMVGSWLEERAGLSDAEGGRFPFHRILLGQIGLLVYFYLRSLLSNGAGIPGVSRVELVLVVLAAGGDLARRRWGR